ncbi:MAG TPA: metalloregulator ArsR/SmtB family transcription factor [Steroidobacteraceae bacterium]|nr:metalloregulator ArsR/SmtB family transcription factor [Steroidobacteraceae bacterium]
MKSSDAVIALAALAQESRLAVYRLLVTMGPEGLAASDIAQRLDIASPTLSFHLKALNHAGLVEARQDGRFIYYSASYPTMNDLLDYLTENCCGGAACATEPAATPRATRKKAS